MTASDRSALIRLASSLPAGSEERRAILSAVGADKPSTTLFRGPYYHLLEGLMSLEDAAKRSKDRDLARLLSKVEAALEGVNAHLNSKYTWDR